MTLFKSMPVEKQMQLGKFFYKSSKSSLPFSFLDRSPSKRCWGWPSTRRTFVLLWFCGCQRGFAQQKRSKRTHSKNDRTPGFVLSGSYQSKWWAKLLNAGPSRQGPVKRMEKFNQRKTEKTASKAWRSSLQITSAVTHYISRTLHCTYPCIHRKINFHCKRIDWLKVYTFITFESVSAISKVISWPGNWTCHGVWMYQE